MKNLLFAVLLLITLVPLSAQQETKLFTLEKPIEGFHRQGLASVYSKSSYGVNTSTLTPRIDMVGSTSGVVIKTDYDLYKFDFSGKQLWKVQLEKFFTLQGMPGMQMFDSEAVTYVWENTQFPNRAVKVAVSQIDSKGALFKKEYESDLKDKAFDVFMLKGNLCVVSKNLNKKAKTIDYEFCTVNKTDATLSFKKISLPADEYEFENYHYWRWLGTMDGHAVFGKLYAKELEKKSNKAMVIIELLEVDENGNISNPRNLSFDPVLAGSDRLFLTPQMVLNPKDNSITLIGLMDIDKRITNAMYLMKYDYSTGSLIYKKEHHFKDILKPEIKTEIKAKYEMYPTVEMAYSRQISKKYIVADNLNESLDVRLIADFDNNNSSFFEVRFDKYGDNVQTGLGAYLGHLMLFENFAPTPLRYQLIWKDKTRPHANKKPGMWDYIDTKASNDKDTHIYWATIANDTQNTIIRFDQKEGSFSMINSK